MKKTSSARRRLLIALGAAAAAAPALAAPLDPEACARLRGEHARLVATGIKGDLERGAEGAKTRLTPARLEELEHFIDVQEQLLFRCPQPKPAREAAAGRGSDNGARSKRPERREDSESQEGPAATPGKTAATLPATRKVKPKANDAYVPPPKQSGSTPGEAQ